MTKVRERATRVPPKFAMGSASCNTRFHRWLRWVAARRVEENYPFFFVSILVTNAKLMVAEHQFGVDAVEKAESLQDLGGDVPCLMLMSSVGPDFYSHALQQLSTVNAFMHIQNMKTVEDRRRSVGLPDWLQPSAVLSRISFDAVNLDEIAEFTKVLVVNIDAFNAVLSVIDAAFKRKVDSVKDQPNITW